MAYWACRAVGEIMGLSDSDRRKLWARAGNRCSYRYGDETCNELLVMGDGATLVNKGEECHIVGDKPGAARYVDDCRERDSYSNLIILCRNHHKVIDDNEHVYTVEVLRDMKASHEEAIMRATDQGQMERVVIRDAQFKTIVDQAHRAVGMEVNRPAELSNVRSELHVRNAEEAIGFSTNQSLGGITVICSCNYRITVAFTGTAPSSVVCPRCGRSHDIQPW
jgi:hypothetical protein